MVKTNFYLRAIFICIVFISGCEQKKSTEDARPNILICMADDASYPFIGPGTSAWLSTPGFDPVANEGLLFTRAYTPNAKCAPSRACFITGRNSWQLEEAANHWNNFPEKFKTYPEVLAENGYHVGYTQKGWSPGIPGEINGQPRTLTGKAYNDRKCNPPAAHISGNDYTANFVDFLEDNQSQQPFCFWYGSIEPHRRYEYGAGIAKGGKKIADIDSVFSFWPDNDTVRTDLLDYAFEVEYFDQHLQQMLQILEEKGELENTIIIVTADNGMPFPRVKGQAYEYSNHLPLAIRWGQGIKNPGRVVEDYLSFIDFAPTFLELAGIDPAQSGMQPMQGESLTDIFYTSKEGMINQERDHVLIGKERHDVGRPEDVGYPIRGIVKDNYLFIKNFEPSRWPAGNPETGYLNCDGSPTKTLALKAKNHPDIYDYWQFSFGKRPEEELYHLTTDPSCMHNLIGQSEYQSLADTLKNQMMAELKAQEDPRMFGRGGVFDAYPYMDLATQNFYTRYMNGEPLNAGWVNESDFEK